MMINIIKEWVFVLTWMGLFLKTSQTKVFKAGRTQIRIESGFIGVNFSAVNIFTDHMSLTSPDGEIKVK